MMLLTKEERDEVCDKLPNGSTVGDERIAIAKAQLKKVVSKLVRGWRHECVECGITFTPPTDAELQSLLKEAGDE